MNRLGHRFAHARRPRHAEVMDLAELKRKKSRAQELFGNLPGVEGFGVGDEVINVYVRSDGAQRLLPAEFEGVKFNFVLTGDIIAQ